MLSTFVKAASAGLEPVQFVGAVTKSVADANGWDTAGEALDVLSIAQTGDLVVIAFTFDFAGDNTWSWNGMTFTDLFNGTVGDNPGEYVGYHFVQSGDANPYITGVTSGSWDALSIVAAVFRNVSTYINDSDAGGSTGLPNPPSLSTSPTVGRLWVAVGNLDDDAVTDWVAPTNYTLAGSETSTASIFVSSTVIAYRIADLTSDNPNAFGGTGDDAWSSNLSAYR